MTIIAIDFDGTLVEHKYPLIGEDVPLAWETVKELQDAGHNLILWTVRSGEPLQAAVDYAKDKGIEFFGINENPNKKFWNESPKAYAELYIDDSALGCPLIEKFQGGLKPFVNWQKVRKILVEKGIIKMIKCKLAFKLDEVLPSGRIYPKDIFKQAMDNIIKKHIPVVDNFDGIDNNGLIKIDKVIGICYDYILKKIMKLFYMLN